MTTSNSVPKNLKWLCMMLAAMLISFSAFSQQPAANLDQGANGQNTAPNNPVQWQNGNINDNGAHMVEGYSVPYRVIMTNLTIGTPIQITIEYDTKHSGAHAIDFLTYFANLEPHFIWGHTAESVDPLVGVSGVPNTPVYATIPVMDSGEVINGLLQPQTTFNNLPANLKRITLYGGTFASVDPVVYTLEESILGDAILQASTDVQISFTPTSTTAVLAWGGHIATDEAFGAGKGAAGVSGSPYHMRLITWNLNNLGNQDRSLKASTVVLFPDCNFAFSPPSPVCTNTNITFHSTNPNPSFIYSWTVFNSGTNASPTSGTDSVFTVNSGTQAGSFTVQSIVSTLFNGTYLRDTCSTVITVNKVNLSTTQTNVSCFGGSNGSINLTVSGGTAPYTFAWTASGGGVVPSGQASSQNLTGLVAGTYSVTVTDNIGCTSTTSATITQPAAALATTETHVNVSCFNGSNGSIDLSVTGGTSPYSYAWTASGGGVVPSGQAGSQDLTGLVAGTYSVTVTDNNGCTATRSVTITQPPVLATSETHVNVLCFGNATGSIDLSVTGGTPNYTYSWTASGGGVVPSGQASNQDLTGLVAGTYSVTVTDSKGCTATRSVSVTQPAAALSATATQVNVLCFGNATGSIDLTPAGGTSPYTYSWVATGGGTVPSGQASSQDLTGLVAGIYTVTVTDNNGCTTSLSKTITQPAAALSATATQVNVLCFGNATGSIDLTPAGGTAPYSYAWTASGGGVVPAGQAGNQDLTGLVAGTYMVVVTDNNGCTTSLSKTITQPAAALSATATQVNVLCFGNATGSIDLTPSGGTVPYTYAWSASGGGVVPAGQATSQDLTGLVAGTYMVVVTDNNGCTTSLSKTITQPAAALSATATQVNVLCFGNATGSIDLTPSGGTAPYAYAWAATGGGVVPAGQANSQDLTGLVAGIYTVVVTDNNGCTTSLSKTITQPAAALSATATQVNVLCFGQATGSIDLTPAGGTVPYTYAWSASGGGVVPSGQASLQDLTGLVAGTYTVVVTDNNGCTTSLSKTITQPAAGLSTSETHVNVLCFGNATGSIDLSVSGGTPPYTYAWTASGGGVVPSGQASSQDLTGLVAGTYSVVVTDANVVCTASRSVTITQPAAALSATATQVNVLCFGNATGSIDLTPAGGTAPYTYAWSATGGGTVPVGQSTSQDLTGLVAGIYTVVVTDNNGCTTSLSKTITQPASAVSATATQVNVLCFGQATGSIDLTPSGGTPPYTYAWTGSAGGVVPAGQASSQDLTGLVAGTYSVIVTDNNGCTTSLSKTITQPASAVSATATQVNVLCFGQATGSIDLTPSGGTPPYTYAWTASAGGVVPAGQASGQDLTGLVAGTYSVVVTDNNGCTTSLSKTITQPASAVSATATQVNVLCFGGATGSIDLTPAGGTPPYTYAWTASSGGVVPSGQSTSQDLTGLVAGTYSVVVTDNNGCTTSLSKTITQPASAVSSTISHTDITCNGLGNGTIDLTPSGGTSPYTYAWTASAGGVVPSGQSTSQDLSGLVAGTYSVVVTDNNGCTTTNSATISEPSAVTCSITAPSQQPACGSSGNSLSATASGGTGTIGFNWSVSGSGWSISGSNTGSSISYTAGSSGPATFTLIVTDANGCSHTCTLDVNCTSANQFCSLTQGFYGNTGGTYCNGMNTTQLLNYLLGFGDIVLGVPANNKTFTVPSTGTTCVINILPGNGTPYVLPGVNSCSNLGTLINNKGVLNNILLAQTLTLALNLRLDNTLSGLVFTSPEFYTRSSTGCGGNTGVPMNDSTHFLLPASVYNYLSPNVTVQAIYTLANNALGGVTGLPSLGDINQAVSICNVAFDNCAFIYFIPQTKNSGGEGTPIVSADQNISLSIVPNPFREETQISFSVNKDTKATVEVYSLVGTKLATIFSGGVASGETYQITYTPPTYMGQQVLVCVVRTPAGTEVRKMILLK